MSVFLGIGDIIFGKMQLAMSCHLHKLTEENRPNDFIILL